jgi:BNR/Asp-box repeat
MNVLKHLQMYVLAGSFIVALPTPRGLEPRNSDTSNASAATHRDGQHDFDFSFGTWKTHIKRRLHPLTGSTTWVEFDGVSIVHKLWNGRAGVGETEADGPAGHIEALSLRTYNPEAHQWNLSYASGQSGSLGSVPTVGEFKNGRGEFYDGEIYNGRSILVRNIWSDITATSCHFEQAFSDDGGKTWEVNWDAIDTRVEDDSEVAKAAFQRAPTQPEIQHDFDFELGSSKIHLSRLQDRLAGSTAWIPFDGTSVTRPLWNGRADVNEFEADSQTGHIEGLTLRLYNPESHQWSIYWANSKDGIFDPPMIGEFKNGRGEFYCQQLWKGRAVFVRFFWTNTTTSTPHFEQAFSDDGGKTWEVNWITNQTRVGDVQKETR